jgi:hypothetical protein
MGTTKSAASAGLILRRVLKSGFRELAEQWQAEVAEPSTGARCALAHSEGSDLES